jgi:hypothetical protein
MVGDFETLLTTVTFPDNAAAAFGEKTTLKVDRFPGPIVRGSEMPVIVTPADLVLAWVTVRFDLPSFEMLTD